MEQGLELWAFWPQGRYFFCFSKTGHTAGCLSQFFSQYEVSRERGGNSRIRQLPCFTAGTERKGNKRPKPWVLGCSEGSGHLSSTWSSEGTQLGPSLAGCVLGKRTMTPWFASALCLTLALSKSLVITTHTHTPSIFPQHFYSQQFNPESLVNVLKNESPSYSLQHFLTVENKKQLKFSSVGH